MRRAFSALILFVSIVALASCGEYKDINADPESVDGSSETTVYTAAALLSETAFIPESSLPETAVMPGTTSSFGTTAVPETTTVPETTVFFETALVSAATGTSDVPETELRVYYVTSERNNGEMATLTVVGKPDTEYTIKVYYSTRASEAKGLEKKISDRNGMVSWTWKVGANTKPGEHKIVVQGGGEKLETSFTTY